MATDPQIAQPIAQPLNDGALAPWPIVDRYPVVIGPGLSLAYVSSVFRLSLLGYRQQYVDLLDELLEKEPHGFSVLSRRILSVADGRLELTPADLPDDADDKETERAQEICTACDRWLRQIPDLHQHLASLLWALYYAIGGAEIHWTRDADGWRPARLSMVHSRRLSYPLAGSWDLYIWDQGQVLPQQAFGVSPTTANLYGLRVADYPGKFIVHAPQMRGSYPTRDGLGRQLAYWFVLKLIGTRGGSQYLERFAKPWVEGTYTTHDDGKPRAADKDDIEAAITALKQMGAGSLASYVHPDTIKIDTKVADGTRPKLTFREWIEICNGEISKAVAGATLTTEAGNKGARALGTVHESGEMRLANYDARSLAETLKRDLVSWMVRLNFGAEALKYTPNVAIHVEADPSPDEMIQRAVALAGVGMPIDADEFADQVGIPLVPQGDTKKRRLAPVKMLDLTQLDPDFAVMVRDNAPEEPTAPTGAEVTGPDKTTQPEADGTQAGDEGDDEPLSEAAE